MFRIFLASLLLVLACSSDADRKAEHVAKAEAFLSEEDLATAIIELKNALAITPRDVELQLSLAQAHAAAGAGAQALFYFDEAVRLDPRRIEAHLGRARLLRRADPEAAHAAIDAALEAQPGSLEAQLEMARLERARSNSEEAREAALRAIELDPESASARFELGRAELVAATPAQRNNEPRPEALAAALAAFEAGAPLADPAERSRYLAWQARTLALWPEREREAVSRYRAALDAAEDPAAIAQIGLRMARYGAQLEDDAVRSEALERVVAATPERLFAWVELARAAELQETTSGAAVYQRLLAARSEDAAAHLAWVRYLAARERSEEAEAHLLAQADAGVEPARMLRTLAGFQYDAGRVEAADATIERLVREHRKGPDTGIAQARQALFAGDPERAEAILEPLVSTYPRADALRLLATAQLRTGRLEEAARSIDRAVEGSPRDGRPRALRGHIAHAREDWNRSLRDLAWVSRRVRALQPVERWMLAVAFYESGAHERGRALLERELEAEAPFVRFVSEWIEREGGNDPERAEAVLARALADQPSNPTLLALAASQDLAEGDRASAEVRISKALEEAPNAASLRLARARLRIATGRLDEAEADVRAAFEADPRYPAADLLVRLLGSQGRIDEAIAELEAAQQAGRLQPSVTLLLATVQRQSGDPRRAVALLEELVAARDDYALAKNDLAWMLASSGAGVARAEQLANEALADLPSHPNVLHTAGYVALLQGRHDLAARHLESAAKRSETAGEPLALYQYHLGLAYRRVAKNRSAVEAFERALEIEPDFAEADRLRVERAAALAGEAPSGPVL